MPVKVLTRWRHDARTYPIPTHMVLLAAPQGGAGAMSRQGRCGRSSMSCSKKGEYSSLACLRHRLAPSLPPMGTSSLQEHDIPMPRVKDKQEE